MTIIQFSTAVKSVIFLAYTVNEKKSITVMNKNKQQLEMQNSKKKKEMH